jgi:hypothetical protein
MYIDTFARALHAPSEKGRPTVTQNLEQAEQRLWWGYRDLNVSWHSRGPRSPR